MDIVNQTKSLMLSLGAAPILWLMVALSFVSLTVIVERALYFRAAACDFPTLMSALSAALRAGDLLASEAVLRDERSVEGEVTRAGLREWHRGARAVREALASALAVQTNLLERRLGFLGTLGNNAPFVGLLGTVIGIMLAFDELARAGQRATATEGVMGSIAEALVATAIGLCVAIPAVAAFNWFQRKIRTIRANSEALAHLLLTYLETHEASADAADAHDQERGNAAPKSSLSLCMGE